MRNKTMVVDGRPKKTKQLYDDLQYRWAMIMANRIRKRIADFNIAELQTKSPPTKRALMKACLFDIDKLLEEYGL